MRSESFRLCSPRSQFVDAGGLMYYGADHVELRRRTSTYVDKILKGTNPGDLPIERLTKVDFVINLKTAKQIGVTISPAVLLHATKVIKYATVFDAPNIIAQDVMK
jgi:putative tryptophan/tyrosine transport system substrate-binding protein